MSYPHMAAGWAVAGDTPFTWTKQVALNFGGTRNGMVAYWPKRITAKGEVRSQFHHVIDVAPTVLEAAGLPEPKVVNGTPQKPIEGVSMGYTFDDAKAEGRHKVQYFEMIGNRAIYADGWVRGDHSQGAVGGTAAQAAPRRHVGAVRHPRGLQPRDEPGRSESGEAEGAAGPVPEGGREVQRAAHRRPQYRAPQCDARRASGPHGRPHVAHAVRRHDGHFGERVHQREEPIADHHCRRRDSGTAAQAASSSPKVGGSAGGAST